MAALFNFPVSCSKVFRWTLLCFAICFIWDCIFAIFFDGSEMVKFLPSKTQPSISLVKSKKPSFSFIFFSEMGSPPMCLLTGGGGNMLCMPCNVARAS